MKRRILINAGTTVAQLLGNAVVLFFLYRFLLRSMGIERLGVWSLLLATTSLVTLANQGLSMSIVKFVAKYAARENAADISLLVQTALTSAGAILAVISLILYPAARWALAVILPASRLPEAVAILPLALASLWFNVLGTIVQAALVGHEWIALCNLIEFTGSISYLALAFLFVPRYGLLGLAAAQAAQAALGLLAAWWLLRRRVPQLPLAPYRWSSARFREMAGYGVHFQLITFCQSMREPVTKALLAKFSGLAATGFYDMASRLVVTLREAIVQSNQVLVPRVANLHERDHAAIPRIYRESYRIVLFLAVPSFSLLVVASPLVSRIWIGHYEPMFMDFVAILTVGWFINAIANPAYVVNLGTGSLKWVSIGCTLTAILNLALGLLAGLFRNATAIVAVSATSLIIGYLVVLVAYHLEAHEDFRVLFPRESRTILALSVAGALLLSMWLVSPTSQKPNSYLQMISAVATLATLIAMPVWTHPVRRRLFQWFSAGMPT
jgi:O-antigen/teichoic acid export membrane protein